MISVDNVTIRFGAFTLFDSISFQLSKNDRVGLVGRNGAGKTTLLNLIDGRQQPDEGMVVRSGSTDIGYLPQQMRHSGSRTLYNETLQAFGHILEIEAKIASLNKALEERTDYESDGYMKLIEQLHTLTERFELEGGSAIHADVEQTLVGLGFSPSDMDRPVTEFSGGWRMRIELAKILLRKPDYILLDEPTNHLDIDSIQWLEDYLATFGGGVLVISHDRIFLDRVTNRTLDLSLGKIYDYKVGFSQYVKLKEERIEHQSASYENQQKMIRDTEKFIERFRYKATKAVQVQSRVKQLDKLDRIEVEQEDRLSMHLRFPVAKRSGKIVMEIGQLSKSYGDNEVLKDIDMVIQRGEKVAFVGRNGEGKTTLSRIIVGELDYRGGFKLGHNVELGYFAQNQDELMDENKTVLETVDAVAVGDIRTKMRDILGAFLFRGEDVDKKVKVLSGGERSRLAMAVMILQPFNLLILDEPTNHLDMNSKDILKNALLQYDGTLIVVSHDREFLDGLVDKVYEFRNKGIREYIGGIFEFLEKRKIRSIREIERRGAQPKVATASGEGSKMDYQEKKVFERKLRKHERAVKELEDAIAASEKEISEMDRIMAEPDNIEDQSLFFSYREKRNELDRLMERWERASSDLEQLKGS
ncbi:MAG: ABC-F family ATP-binding cassette domain-containing protein [Bacteroidales bacterium]|nr:ABC-F family ATP-binding cassette domain-containing protein [Bacteroidales bacterium]MDT8431239.1 ABC-F family ATP-binding cassette domain-containing protein [Bacteroidales bacterium]